MFNHAGLNFELSMKWGHEDLPVSHPCISSTLLLSISDCSSNILSCSLNVSFNNSTISLCSVFSRRRETNIINAAVFTLLCNKLASMNGPIFWDSKDFRFTVSMSFNYFIMSK